MANETSKRWLIFGGLLALTLWLVWNAPAPESDVVTVSPVMTRHLGDQTMNNTVSDAQSENRLSLKPRESINGKEFDLFATHLEKRPKRIIKSIIKPVENHKPKAPSLPFTYIGKLIEGQEVKVFLMNGQALYIVSEGDKVGDDYQLTHVDDKQLSWLYLPLNIAQQMSIGKAP